MKETDTQRNWNEYFDNPKKPKTNIRWGLILFLFLCIGSAALYVHYNPSNQNTANTANTNNTNINLNSAKNGEVMAESLETIENIFLEINKKDLAALNSDMTILDNIALSSEYNNYINTVKLKLNYYINYRETLDTQYLDMYNDIDMFSSLAEAFNKAGVSYTLYNDRIEYTYKP